MGARCTTASELRADVSGTGRERTVVHVVIRDDLALDEARGTRRVSEREGEADAADAREDTAALVAAERRDLPA